MLRLGPGLGIVDSLARRAPGPATLFAAGAKGVWFDPSDLATVWQDAARTVPGAVGAAVGCIDDKSGNGKHATQTAAACKPVLRQSGGLTWLEFDGVDDFLSTAAMDLTATDKLTLWAAVRKLGDAAAGEIIGLSANPPATNGTFDLLGPSAAAPNFGFDLRGTQSTGQRAAGYAAPASAVISLKYDLAGVSGASEIIARINGVSPTVTTAGAADAGTGSFGNHVLFIGRRGGSALPFNGHVHGLIIRGAASTPAEISGNEAWLAAKVGVTF